MAHTRIRKFNTRDTYPEQKLDNDLCQAVVARGRMVFLRGQVGQDLDSALNVGVGDAAAQAEQAMKNIKQLLAEAGAELAPPIPVGARYSPNTSRRACTRCPPASWWRGWRVRNGWWRWT